MSFRRKSSIRSRRSPTKSRGEGHRRRDAEEQTQPPEAMMLSDVATQVPPIDEEAAIMPRLERWVQLHTASPPRSQAALLRALETDLCWVKRSVCCPSRLFQRLVALGHIEFVHRDCLSSPSSSSASPVRHDGQPVVNIKEERDDASSSRSRSSSPAPRSTPSSTSLRPLTLAFHSTLPSTTTEGAEQPRLLLDDDAQEGLQLDCSTWRVSLVEARAAVEHKVRRWLAQQEARPATSPTSIEAAKKALGQLCMHEVGFRPERLLELLQEKHYLRLVDERADKRQVEWLLLDKRELCKRKTRVDRKAEGEDGAEEQATTDSVTEKRAKG